MLNNRIALLESAKTRRIALAAKASIGNKVTVDRDAGIIRNCAVMQDGDTGHGFAIDKTTREQVMKLINADPDGVKMHFKHPEVKRDAQDNVVDVEDQLGAMVGRMKNARQDGDTLRADVHLGEYAKKLPVLGDVHAYLLDVAENDPSAIGLSAVFSLEPEVINDAAGQPKMIVARVTELHQVDFVGKGAATPNGLLSFSTTGSTATPTATADAGEAEDMPDLATITAAVVAVTAAAQALLGDLRTLRDTWTQLNASSQASGTFLLALAVAKDSATGFINAARNCTDTANAIPPGSIVDQGLSDTVKAMAKAISLSRDECYDVSETLASLRYSRTDLAAAVNGAAARIRTAITESDTVWSATTDLSIGIATLRRKLDAEADVIGRLAGALPARALAMKTYLAAQNSAPDQAKSLMIQLQRKAPAAAAHVASKFPIIFGTALVAALAKHLPTKPGIDNATRAYVAARLRGVEFGIDSAGGLTVTGGSPEDNVELWSPFAAHIIGHLKRIEGLEQKVANETDPETVAATARHILFNLDPLYVRVQETDAAFLARGLKAMGISLARKSDNTVELIADNDETLNLLDDSTRARIAGNATEIISILG